MSYSDHSPEAVRRAGGGVFLAVAVVVIACAPPTSAAPPDSTAPPESSAPATTTADDGQGSAEWQENLDALASMPLEELHELAVEEEDGRVVFWGGNSLISADRAGIGPAFEAAFPGMSVVQFGEGGAAELIARLAAEIEAGLQPNGDLFWGTVEDLSSAYAEGILADWDAPEAAAYPDELKGPYYVITDFIYHGVAWNTDRVSADEAPTSFEDLTDPKWKGRIIAEPRIATQLAAIAERKFESEEAARDWAEALAENDITMIPRYPALGQAIATGEYDVCFNCNSHTMYDLIQEGAPVEYMRTEAMALPVGQMIIANPLHPYGAMLMARWIISEDGQSAFAAGHKNPAHPDVAAPDDAIVPDTQYLLHPEDLQEIYPAWEAIATELFELR